jgi:HK97 family phage prohead protease
MSALAEQLFDDGVAAAETLGAVYRSITGLVVPYNTPTDIGLNVEEFDRGAFTASLVARSAVPLLLWHDRRTFPLGVATAWDDRRDGLHATFNLAMTPVAQFAGNQAAQGFLTGLSVGFTPGRSSVRRYAQEWNPELGPDYMDHVVRHEARLHEVSMTPTPAFADARVYAVESTALHSIDYAAAGYATRQALPAPPGAPIDLSGRVDTLEERVDGIDLRLEVVEGTIGGAPTPYDV